MIVLEYLFVAIGQRFNDLEPKNPVLIWIKELLPVSKSHQLPIAIRNKSSQVTFLKESFKTVINTVQMQLVVVRQKWKSCSIRMLFTFCYNNKIFWAILVQQTPNYKGSNGLKSEHSADTNILNFKGSWSGSIRRSLSRLLQEEQQRHRRDVRGRQNVAGALVKSGFDYYFDGLHSGKLHLPKDLTWRLILSLRIVVFLEERRSKNILSPSSRDTCFASNL